MPKLSQVAAPTKLKLSQVRPSFGDVAASVSSTEQEVKPLTREQRQAQIAKADSELDYENRLNSLNRQEQAGRISGIGGRGILTGLTAIPDLVAGPLTNLANRVLPGNMQQQSFGSGVNALLDLAGTPRAETPGERIYQDTTSGVASAAVPIGAGNTMAQSVRPVIRAVGQTLSSSPLAQLAGGGTGALASSTTREAGGGPLAQFGAGLLGGLLPFAPGAMVRPNSTITERAAANQIRSEAANPAALDVAAPSQVPGVQRSLAEQTLDPGIARLERQVRGRTSEFTPIDSANAAARDRLLRTIAGDDADMTAAIRARDTATGGMRDAAFNEADQIAAQAMQYGAAPAGNVAGLRQQFTNLANVQGGRGSVQRTVDTVINDLDRAEPSAQGLYQVRKSINDMLEGTAGSERDFARAASAELMQMRNMVDAELANLAPSFENYRATFQNMSRPINRMEVGQELLRRGAGAVADPTTGVRPLLPAGLSRQTVNLDELAQRATGFDNAVATDILTPDDINAIRAIQDDLERQNFRATAGSGGNSMTAERQALAQRLGRSSIEAIPIVGRFVERLRELNQPRIDATIARLIADPAEARRVLASMAPQDRQVLVKAMLMSSAAQNQENQ